MKNKYVAAALAFFLGGLGAHKFYLGKNLQGIIYLVFFWTYVPAIIAFIECITYLCMSETEFQNKYCSGNSSSNDTYLQNVQQESWRKKKCPNCGAENDINNKFCEFCGTKF